MIIQTGIVSDEELYQYYTEFFKRDPITKTYTEYGVLPDLPTTVQSIRTIQNYQDGFSVMYMNNDLKLVGAFAGVVSPCFFSATKFALEVTMSTIPGAPARTTLRLHEAFAQWAKEKNCKYAEVSDGPYTPATYERLLTHLDYKKTGGVYFRRL